MFSNVLRLGGWLSKTDAFSKYLQQKPRIEIYAIFIVFVLKLT